MHIPVKVAVFLFLLVNYSVSAGNDLVVTVQYHSGSSVKTLDVILDESLMKKVTNLSGEEKFSIKFTSLKERIPVNQISSYRIRIENIQQGETKFPASQLVKFIEIIPPCTDIIVIQENGNSRPENRMHARVVLRDEKPGHWAQVKHCFSDLIQNAILIFESTKYVPVDEVEFGSEDPDLYIVFSKTANEL